MKDTAADTAQAHSFFPGGGEMGALMQQKDWRSTELGDPSGWPQSLRVSIDIMLHSRFPGFIWWGPSHICFYNDAYRPILGENGKHPGILGVPGKEAWPELWHYLQPLVDEVFSKGHSIWKEDQPMQIFRNGRLESIAGTFSYSPIRGGSGAVEGIFVTCVETTEKIINQQRLTESKQQLEFAMDAAELGVWDLNPITRRFTGNHRLKEWHGLPAEAEFDLSRGIATVGKKDQAALMQAVENALQPGSNGVLDMVYTITSAVTNQQRIVHTKGKTTFNREGAAVRLNGIVMDVTRQVLSQRKKEESDRQLRLSIAQAPVAIAIFRGPSFIVETVNKRALELWGRTEEDVLQRPILEAMPELIAQGIPALLNHVFTTGIGYTHHELPLQIERNHTLETVYVNVVYEALYDERAQINGIMAVGTDVSAQVHARKKIEISKEQLAIAIEGGELGTFDVNPVTGVFNWSARTKAMFGLPEDAEVNYAVYLQALEPRFRDNSAAIAMQQVKLADDGLYELEYGVIGVNDGKRRWLRSKGKATYNTAGEPVRYTGIIQDITERRNAELALHESEQRFRTMAEGSDFLIITCNEAGLATYFNKSWEYLTGRTTAALIQNGWQDLIHPDDREAILHIYKEAFRKQAPWQAEFRLMGSLGDYHWVLIKSLVRSHEDGNFAGYISSGLDITERKQAEEAIARFKFMADNANDAFILMRPDAGFEYLNSVALANWGYHPEEASGLTVPDVDLIYDEQGFKDLFERARHQTIAPFETIHVKKDGSTYPVEVIVSSISAGNKEYLFAIARDITERKKIESSIRQSRQRLSDLVNSAPFPIGVYTGREMRIELANQAILDVWGKGNNVTGKLYADILPELQNQDVFQQLDDVFTSGLTFASKNQRIDLQKDGVLQPYYFNYTFTPLFDESGKIYGVMNTGADVTDLNLAKQLAEESEKRFRKVANSAPVLIWMSDTDKRYNFFNTAWLDFTGRPLEDEMGYGWRDGLHPDDIRRVLNSYAVSFDRKEAFYIEYRLRRNDGLYRWVSEKAVPRITDDGIFGGYIGACMDIQDIKEQDQQKDYFISMASHELKTPITSMKGYLQLLKLKYQPSTDAFLKKAINVMERQIETQIALIGELLDLSKIKSGKLTLHKENWLVSDLLQETIDQVNVIHPDYTILLTDNCYRPDLTLHADRERISQVMINLLTNAIKYSPASTEIQVHCAADDQQIRIAVQDFGIGIESRDQQKIFERFYRVDGLDESTFPGFGIGLFISAEIIRKHKGQIGVDSEPGKGSTFFFTLPLTNQ
jgi:PAS domain S-box-containing protein